MSSQQTRLTLGANVKEHLAFQNVLRPLYVVSSGDSQTGGDVITHRDVGFADCLVRLAGKRLCKVANMGESGKALNYGVRNARSAITVDAATFYEDLDVCQQQRMIFGLKPDIIIAELGTNDFGTGDGVAMALKHIRMYESVELSYAIQGHKCIIIHVGMMPPGSSGNDAKGSFAIAFNGVLRDYANAKGHIFIDSYHILGDGGELATTRLQTRFDSDGAHITALGRYALMVSALTKLEDFIIPRGTYPRLVEPIARDGAGAANEADGFDFMNLVRTGYFSEDNKTATTARATGNVDKHIAAWSGDSHVAFSQTDGFIKTIVTNTPNSVDNLFQIQVAVNYITTDSYDADNYIPGNVIMMGADWKPHSIESGDFRIYNRFTQNVDESGSNTTNETQAMPITLSEINDLGLTSAFTYFSTLSLYVVPASRLSGRWYIRFDGTIGDDAEVDFGNPICIDMTRHNLLPSGEFTV